MAEASPTTPDPTQREAVARVYDYAHKQTPGARQPTRLELRTVLALLSASAPVAQNVDAKQEWPAFCTWTKGWLPDWEPSPTDHKFDAWMASARSRALVAPAGGYGWRPEVAAFAGLMEQQLRANDHKPGWKSDAAPVLFLHLSEEMEELNLAITSWRLNGTQSIDDLGRGADPLSLKERTAIVGKEAADVANFAMMIADVCGALTPSAPSAARETQISNENVEFGDVRAEKSAPSAAAPSEDAAKVRCEACSGEGGFFHGYTNAGTREEWDKCEFCGGDGMIDSRTPPTAAPVEDAIERALNGYRAAVSWIGADSWDGCPDCIDVLKAARAADVEWDWAGDQNRVAAELKHIEPFMRALKGSHAAPAGDDAGLSGAVRTIIARCEALEDEALDALDTVTVNGRTDTHEAGFWRGQKSTAKSIRNHLHDLTRAALSASPARATFERGDRVEKISGSAWRGAVVGTYSTALTPEGYAVESENEPGSVQIYPAKALRLASPAPQGDAK